MSNNPYENIVPTEESQLPNSTPYSSQPMETVVGVTQVANNSFDIFGNQVSSTGDTPIDVNALQGAVVTEESLTAPSTGFLTEVDTSVTVSPQTDSTNQTDDTNYSNTPQ